MSEAVPELRPPKGIEEVLITAQRDVANSGGLSSTGFANSYMTDVTDWRGQPYLPGPGQAEIRGGQYSEDVVKDLLRQSVRRRADFEPSTPFTDLLEKPNSTEFEKLMSQPARYFRIQESQSYWKDITEGIANFAARTLTKANIAAMALENWDAVRYEMTHGLTDPQMNTLQDEADWQNIVDIAPQADVPELQGLSVATRVKLFYQTLDRVMNDMADAAGAAIEREKRVGNYIDQMAELIAQRNIVLSRMNVQHAVGLEEFLRALEPGSGLHFIGKQVAWDPVKKFQWVTTNDGIKVRFTFDPDGKIRLEIDGSKARRQGRQPSAQLKWTHGMKALAEAAIEFQWQRSLQLNLDPLPDLEVSIQAERDQTGQPIISVEFRLRTKTMHWGPPDEPPPPDFGEHRIRRGEFKTKSQQKYLAYMKFITKTWGTVTEIGDAAKALLDSFRQKGTGRKYARWDTLWKDMKRHRVEWRMDNFLENLVRNEVGDRLGAAANKLATHAHMQGIGHDPSHPSVNQGPLLHSIANRGQARVRDMLTGKAGF